MPSIALSDIVSPGSPCRLSPAGFFDWELLAGFGCGNHSMHSITTVRPLFAFDNCASMRFTYTPLICSSVARGCTMASGVRSPPGFFGSIRRRTSCHAS
jgi:hypothetical protein